MATLIDRELLKGQLRITHDYEDFELDRFCEEATMLVLERLKETDKVEVSPAEWDEDTVPVAVRGMILRVAAHLYMHRGDEEPSDPFVSIKTAIEMRRDPTIA